jgi:CheY-like chemotaxis protein
MMSDGARRLLWTDDDGPDRFMFECHMLEKSGWKVDWALDVTEALDRLAKVPYDALLLDQMLPWRHEDQNQLTTRETTPWGGYEVLHRLRRAQNRHDKAPPQSGEHGSWVGTEPLAENVGVPVLVISAFYDKDVLAAIRSASVQDRDLVISPKPTNIDEIIDFLNRHRGRP